MSENCNNQAAFQRLYNSVYYRENKDAILARQRERDANPDSKERKRLYDKARRMKLEEVIRLLEFYEKHHTDPS